jgi:hypothetical protein
MQVDNKDVIEAGRNAWNKLSIIMDEDPELFDRYEAFKEFYELLCRKLFEEENSL